MEREIVLRLTPSEVGQLMDGLEVHTDRWRKTAILLEDGFLDEEDFVPFECHKASEARWIALFYEKILDKIQKQFEEQS
jgi:hypothetical protein